MNALRLTGVVRHVVPTTVDGTGKRRGGFGFIRCDGAHSGAQPTDALPLNVDHFFHVRDTRYERVEELADRRVSFIPMPAPSADKGPSAIEVEEVA